eukprot:COSAG06_NODE_11661_length_1480_cov_0.703114_1_plen_101_part_00
MAALMKGVAGNRAKIGVAGADQEGGENLINQAEPTSEEPPTAPPAASATFESEEQVVKKAPAGGAAKMAAAGTAALKGQAVTSGGPDMERILRQGFVRKV